MKCEAYSVSSPVRGITKSYAIWAREGSVTAPLVYLHRPKWIKSDEAWNEIIDAVELNLPSGIEIK